MLTSSIAQYSREHGSSSSERSSSEPSSSERSSSEHSSSIDVTYVLHT